jgi:capsule polysaccharide export protein KpsE/RkpR
VELKDPVLAADTANYAVSLLERILNEKALTVSKKNRRMMESQITEQELKVKELQNKLTSFQQSSGILIPQGQIEQSMTLYSTLVGQKISLEIELSRMESALSADNPKISALKTQLAAVEDHSRRSKPGAPPAAPLP